MPTVIGTLGSDTLNGSVGDDTIDGLEGNDILNGGGGNDRLLGREGNDRLDGGAGVDVMRGGLGDDAYYVDNANDSPVEVVGEGLDAVYSSVSFSLGTNIENLNLTGSAIRGNGNGLANRLVGNAANNILNGGGGADIMRGGLGNDTYYVDNSSDAAIEGSDQGLDTVHSSVNFSLGSNIENLTLTGSAIRGNGNSLANRLVGNALDNILNGGGGADTMRGGLGNDTYYVDNSGDRAVENAGEGTDLVVSSISFTLGTDIENINLTGSAAIDATGNSLDNRLVGNAVDNLLNGGAGADIMRGGAGHDSYFVDNAGDRAIENADEGSDTVYSSISLTLGSNLENLTLTGSGVINGTGNSLDNILRGNTANNVLAGGGGNDVLWGDGIDTLEGGAGNDNYYVDGVPDAAAPDVFFTDTVIEAPGGGSDTVVSLADFYTLPENVEIGRIGNGPDDGHRLDGNDASNTLVGSAGNDFLFGHGGNDIIDGGGAADSIYGGAGADNLTGGFGSDIFFYSAVSDSTPGDTDVIFDYRGPNGTDEAHDQINLSGIDANANADGDQAFTLVGAPTNAAGQLWISSEPGFQYTIFGDVDGDGTADFQLHVVMTNNATVPFDIVY